jgi:hypothetical protein
VAIDIADHPHAPLCPARAFLFQFLSEVVSYMTIKPILIVAALMMAAPAMAEDAPAAGAPLTASAANKASYLVTSNGQTATINHVIAGPNDSISGVSVIYNDTIYLIPGSTVSAGEKNRLKTSLSSKEVRALKSR